MLSPRALDYENGFAVNLNSSVSGAKLRRGWIHGNIKAQQRMVSNTLSVF